MTPRFSTLALALAFAALAAFVVFQVRENQTLRTRLTIEQVAAGRRTAAPRVGKPAPNPAPAGPPDAAPRVSGSDVPALLDRIIHSGAWENVYGAGTRLSASATKELARIDPVDLPRAFARVAAYPPSAARTALQLGLLQAWAATDPNAAVPAVARLPAGEQNAARDEIADVWADTDPAAASRFRPFNESAWDKFVKASPRKAADAALALTGRDRIFALVNVAGDWSRRDPAAAWVWSTSLAPELQLPALNQTVWQMADVNPAAVADYLASAATNPVIANADLEGTSLISLAQATMNKWSGRDPQAAATWATGLPLSSDIRRGAESGVVLGWSSNDPPAARQWIESLPPIDRAQAAQDFVYAVTPDDPATAAAVATQDCDPKSNAAVLTFVAQTWLQSDPAAARAWLAQTTLPAATRAELHRRGFQNLPGDPPPPTP